MFENIQKQQKIYEGKAKILYKTNLNNILLVEFKDDLTAFNAKKKDSLVGKGELNCKITTNIFNMLKNEGIKTHFLQCLDSKNIICHKVNIIPIEVVVRNIATGSLTKRLGIKEGLEIKNILGNPLVEFYYKDDSLNDPIIYDEHCRLLSIADEKDLIFLRESALKINDILLSYFAKANLNLIDFKLEFGKNIEGNIILADEISPDSCRLWDVNTGEKMDKDRFRQELGNIKLAYEEVLKRIEHI